MSLKTRLSALEQALAVDVPRIKLSWPPLDGIYTTETGERLDWEGYVKWHVERGYPKPIRLQWPEAENE